jgi:hypothetical protein
MNRVIKGGIRTGYERDRLTFLRKDKLNWLRDELDG